MSKTMREMMSQKMPNPQRDTKWEKTKETEDSVQPVRKLLVQLQRSSRKYPGQLINVLEVLGTRGEILRGLGRFPGGRKNEIEQ